MTTIEFPGKQPPGALDSYRVSVRLAGEHLQPDLVSGALGLLPDEFHQRGDAHIGNSGRRYADFTEGVWILESKAPGASSLLEHLEHLLAILEGKGEALRSLRRDGLRAEILIGVFETGGHCGFSVPLGILESITSLALDLDFDIYE